MIRVNDLLERILFLKKENNKIYFINKNNNKDWWSKTSPKLVKYILDHPSIIPDEDGFYLILTSERIASIDLSDWITNETFNILKNNNIKIGVSTKLEQDSDNIISIPNYLMLIDCKKYHNYFSSKNNINHDWQYKSNDMIYMGTLNSDFRINAINTLRENGFKKLFARQNPSINNISYDAHMNYKFILDLPTEHKYNFDYSWNIWKKFYFKSVVFHLSLPQNHHIYFYDHLLDGKDWVICKNLNDIIEKYDYYLNHQDEAKKIAQNGYNKIISIVNNYDSEYKKYLQKCRNSLDNLKYFNL